MVMESKDTDQGCDGFRLRIWIVRFTCECSARSSECCDADVNTNVLQTTANDYSHAKTKLMTLCMKAGYDHMILTRKFSTYPASCCYQRL